MIEYRQPRRQGDELTLKRGWVLHPLRAQDPQRPYPNHKFQEQVRPITASIGSSPRSAAQTMLLRQIGRSKSSGRDMRTGRHPSVRRAPSRIGTLETARRVAHIQVSQGIGLSSESGAAHTHRRARVYALVLSRPMPLSVLSCIVRPHTCTLEPLRARMDTYA